MAGNIKGITIEFLGDTTKLDKALRDISNETKAIDQELRKVNTGLKFNPTSVELWQQKQKLLTDKISQTKNKLDALKQAQKKMDASGVDRNSAEYRELQREIVTTESKLKNFKAQLYKVGNAKLTALGQQFKQFGDKVKDVGQTLTQKITMPLAALGVISLKTGADFDKSMSQVAATMGKPISEVQDLRDFAKEMGSTTAFSAKEAADGLNYMALAGYDAEMSMKMLPTVLNLAAAGNMDLARASDMVTDAQSALGLSAEDTEKLIDQMAKTASTTNTSVEQLGSAILTVGGTAKIMKGGPAELAQVLGLLADNGIKGSEGGTALRNVLLSLSSPTAKGATQLELLGVKVFDANGEMRSMTDIMADMNKGLSKLTDEQRTQAIATIFNKRDLKSVNALLGTDAQRWDDVANAISNAGGAAAQMADTQLDNMAGSLTILKSALEGAAIAISDQLAPYVRMLAEWLTDLVSRFNALDPSVQRVIVLVGTFAAAIGPVLVVVGSLISMFGSAIAMIGRVGTAVSGLISGLMAMNPVVLIVIAVIAALIAIGILLWKNWDKIKAKATEIKNNVVKTFNNLKTAVINAFNTLKSKVTSTWNAIKTAIMNPVNKAKDAVKKAIDKIKGFFNFKFKWPHVPMPHFSVTPAGWKMGDLLKGKIPKLNVDWYDEGGIFDSPSIIGVGEKRPEFVGALDDLRKIVREESGAQQTITINVYASENQSVQDIAKEVERRLIESQNRRRLAWK